MVEVGVGLAFQAAPEGSSGLGFARLPWTHVASPHSKTCRQASECDGL